jgi:hypothetical protein
MYNVLRLTGVSPSSPCIFKFELQDTKICFRHEMCTVPFKHKMKKKKLSGP